MTTISRLTRRATILLALALFALTITNSTAGTVYIENPTNGSISFSYKTADTGWDTYRLDAGETYTMSGDTPHTIKINMGSGILTYNCKNGQTYYFEWRNRVINFFHRSR